MAVKNLLVQRGIADSRIEAVGYGETLPVATNDTEAGRQRNRRVEIKIAPQTQQ
jgi:outer membrane protein OmpA-like peptidoglycan-associated protein